MNIDLDPTETPLRDLRAAATSDPDRTFIDIAGATLSYGELWDETRRAAAGLRDAGLRPGDRAVIMAPNSIEVLVAWFAVQLVGAVDAPVSVEAPGPYLAHVLGDLEARVAFGTPETLEVLRAAAPTELELLVAVDEPAGSTRAGDLGSTTLRDLVAAAGHEPDELEPPQAAELGTIMYSSGTTGPSKGVMLSHGYYSTLARVHATFARLSRGARIYCTQPLCHIDARSAVIDALHLRGQIVLGTRFSASGFWDEVEKNDIDVFFYVGTMIHLIFKQPIRAGAPTRRRVGLGSATPASIHREFERRFDVDLVEGYGMTEFGIMAGQTPGRALPGTVGEVVDWVEARIVDSSDQDVEDGQSGELLVRPRAQHLHMLGYWRRPEATVEAWRGLWFHTGDVLRRQPNGALEYVGRTKDSIRRRGENVSAWEVEEAAARHPGVLEAAAIGVPSELGEEDVALVVVASPGIALDVRELRERMSDDLPRYALPRYVDVVSELPKTPSERVAKGAVRERGLSAGAVDLEPRRT
ncbi:AMP-binding protein [Aeromicrobium sp. 50.2.37]|uniref:AMP-binding protein n=1 Tax=Aeromicrobium sp. 50.2.37 TaxID=2969305 RepID=UPI002150636C|nr:AMP-binding protein [Aeromicrobium sp. 50.2.37]MCR4512651.1 AMP-binding protein [Aeromicrobium sp. 50.2.37]